MRDELATLERRTAAIADCVRHLSHGLHPGVLRHAGLPAALKAYCAEFHALHGIDLTFRADERIGAVPVPPDDALCLYRVAQEALSNVARHAEARRVRVTLAEADGGLALDVADDGRGFDLADAGQRAGGMGLSSAEERVRLADGTLSIDAAPGRGTTVRAWVPLRRPDNSRRSMTMRRVLVCCSRTTTRSSPRAWRGCCAASSTCSRIVGDGGRLVEAARRLRPDVVVADMSMPVLSGMDALRQMRADRPGLRLVFLTQYADPGLAGEAIRAGASGYVLKQSSGEELQAAIREALAGRVYLSPRITGAVVAALARPAAAASSVAAAAAASPDAPAGTGGSGRLTPRQREVLRLVAEGKTMKEVAAALRLSRRTVEGHKYEMMQQLGVETTAGLIHFAVRHGLAAP